MIFCTQCGAAVADAHQYCWNCGAKAETSARVPGRPGAQTPVVQVEAGRTTPPKGFMRLFGLDPRIAFATLIVDMMLNAGDLATMGLLVPVSVAAGVVMGFVTYRAQMSWAGDDKESARIKGIIIGLLTAIPTPIPELLYIPAGLVGFFNRIRRKEIQA
jgi:hypothetical protein